MPNLAAEIEARVLAEHPGATRIQRGVDRFASTWLLPSDDLPRGRNRFHKRVSGRPLFFQDAEGDHEVDTDFERLTHPRWGAQAKWAGRGRLPFGSRVSNVGERRFTPRPDHPDEWVEFGRPEWETAPGVWGPVPLGNARRDQNRMVWDREHHGLEVANLPGGVKATLVLKDPTHAGRRVRWPVMLSGLRRIGRELQATDGTTVGHLAEPTWWDAALGGGAIGWSLEPGYVIYEPPDLTGATFPVYLDPSVSVEITIVGDDGRHVEPSTFSDAAPIVGAQSGNDVDAWYRFPGPLAIPPDADVSVATITQRSITTSVGSGTIDARIFGVDETEHEAPITDITWTADHEGTPGHTTASQAWSFTLVDADDTEMVSADFSAVVEEMAASDFLQGAAGFHVDNDGTTGTNYQAWSPGGGGTYTGPILNVTYTSDYPYIVQVSAVKTQTASATIALNDPTSPTADNLLLAIVGGADVTTGTYTWTSGWTEVLDALQASTHDAVLGAAYDVASAPSLTATNTQTLDSQVGWILEIGNADTATNVPDATTASGTASDPDPPSHTSATSPTTDKILWIVPAVGANAGVTTISGYPTGFLVEQTVGSVDGGSAATVAFAARYETAASKDPAAYNYATDPNAWVAATIAVYPVTVINSPPKRLVIPGMQAASLLSAHRAREI